MDKRTSQLTTDYSGPLLASRTPWSLSNTHQFAPPENPNQRPDEYPGEPLASPASNIVIVDDNEADLFFTTMLLKSKGYAQIKQFHSGAEIVQAYEEGLPCDILFMDVRMPQMDGFDTVEALSQTERWSENKPTVYMVSAAANAEDRKRAEEHAAIREIARKPLSAEALANLVKLAQ